MSSPVTGAKSQADRWIIAALLGYALLHALARVALSDTVELDEAEQVLLAHQFQWGYARQPPLYTWVQTAAFRLLGTNVAALALVKALFLFGAYYFTYATARQASQEQIIGLMAVSSLIFIPQFAWELQRDLTHSAALVAAVAATLYFSLRVLQGGGLKYYVALGVSIAAGLLSKYNYAFFLLPLLGAWISLPEFRPHLRRRPMLLGLVLLLVLPHAAWIGLNSDWLFTSVGPAVLETGSPLLGIWKSFTSLIGAALFFAVPSVAICFGFALGTLPIPPRSSFDLAWHRFLWRVVLGGLGFCLVAVATIRLHFKDRLLLPVLLAVPVLLALVVSRRLPWKRRRLQVTLAGAAAVLLIPVLFLATFLGARSGRRTRLMAPYAGLSAQWKERGIKPDLIVAENRWVGGNLKLQFPESLVVVPELPVPTMVNSTNWVVVWNAEKRDRPPPSLQKLAERYRLKLTVPRYIEAPYKFTREEMMRFGFMAEE